MKFYIVNEYDRPCERLLAVNKGDQLYYIHPAFEKAHEGYRRGMSNSCATPIEDFGVELKVENGKIHGEKRRESKASYPRGGTRQWQGSLSFSFDLPSWV